METPASSAPLFSVQTSTDTIIAEIRARIEALHQLRMEADIRYEQRFTAQEKAVQSALTAQEKAVHAALTAAQTAVDRAEVNAEKWRLNANEWRGAMDDRERRYVMKESLEGTLTAIQKEVNMLQNELNTMRGKGQGMDLIITKIIAVVGAIGSIGFGIAFVTK